MGANSRSLAPHRRIQPEETPQARVHAVCRDDQRTAMQLASNEEARDASLFHDRAVHLHSCECENARSRRCSFEQNLVQNAPALPPAVIGHTCDLREASLGRLAAEMIAHAAERFAPHRLSQAHALEHADSGGHQAFTTGLFARETHALKEFHRQTQPPQQNGQRGTGDATPGNQDVAHYFTLVRLECASPARVCSPWPKKNPGMNRGFEPIAAR